MEKIYVLTANGNYENGRFEVAGVYPTIELAKEAAARLPKRYFTHIEEWDVDQQAKCPRFS